MSESNCLFCRVIGGEIPSNKVYEDDQSYAFRDINPQAPVHVLIIPKMHLASLNEIGNRDEALLGHLMFVARQIAEQEKLSDSGYRVTINTGGDAGQSVFHIHLHLMGGRPMAWPPG